MGSWAFVMRLFLAMFLAAFGVRTADAGLSAFFCANDKEDCRAEDACQNGNGDDVRSVHNSFLLYPPKTIVFGRKVFGIQPFFQKGLSGVRGRAPVLIRALLYYTALLFLRTKRAT